VVDSLLGARVALLEARRESEMASLVRRHGGTPMSVPALREVERDCGADAARAIDAAGRGETVVVLATGVGLERWLTAAKKLGRLDELRGALGGATVVCRGPKPVAVLKREGLPVHVRAPAPHTTVELLEVLGSIDVGGRDVVFVHDGGGGDAVPQALRQRGARVAEVMPYAWALPEDVGPLEQLVESLVAGEVDAIVVTTQAQAAHLFRVADARNRGAALREALRARVVVAAVGPTCARQLEQLGAPPHVVPQQSKMGAVVLELARHLAARAVVP
jgi:uroporphyrinogen-III synthase